MRQGCHHAITLAACLLAAGLLLLSPAWAQDPATRPPGGAELPEAARISISRAGLSNITNVRRRGNVYTLNAVDRNGMSAKVVVSIETGAIIGLRIKDPRIIEQNQ